jgi:hypothetical protein
MPTADDGFIDPPVLSKVAFAITPSDTVPIREPYKYLYVGGTGDVRVREADGTLTTYSALAAGSRLPISPSIIMLTGTTATNLIGEK